MSDNHQEPSENPNSKIRVSNADREHVINILHRNTEAGRLDLTEFNERSQAVYEAKTLGDLEKLLDDLPERSSSGTAIAPAAKEPNLVHSDVPPLVLTPTMSSVKKIGQWNVPPEIKVKSTFSDVILDFTEAVVTTPVVTISIDDKLSDVTVILPPENSYAVDHIKLRLSSVTNECESGDRGGVKFYVTGKTVMSTVKITRKRKSSMWDWS